MTIKNRVNNILVQLDKKEVLKTSDILRYANRCRSSYGYLKINMHNNRYIAVVYNKDNTVFLVSNNRNLQMYTEMDSVMKFYTQDRVVKFLFRWMNIMTR